MFLIALAFSLPAILIPAFVGSIPTSPATNFQSLSLQQELCRTINAGSSIQRFQYNFETAWHLLMPSSLEGQQ
jgi:hypothetical protein